MRGEGQLCQFKDTENRREGGGEDIVGNLSSLQVIDFGDEWKHHLSLNQTMSSSLTVHFCPCKQQLT